MHCYFSSPPLPPPLHAAAHAADTATRLFAYMLRQYAAFISPFRRYADASAAAAFAFDASLRAHVTLLSAIMSSPTRKRHARHASCCFAALDSAAACLMLRSALRNTLRCHDYERNIKNTYMTRRLSLSPAITCC